MSVESPDISPVGWAEDVLWAADRANLKRLDGKTKGRPPSKPPPGVTDRQFSLWRYGREDMKSLMTQLVPKAIAILQKQSTRDDDESFRAEEEIEIEKMKAILTAAIKEAASL